MQDDDPTYKAHPLTPSSSKTRTPRPIKSKAGRTSKPNPVHENGSHNGADHSQTSRCTLCNLIFYNSPPFAQSSWLRIVYETIRLLHDEGNPHRKYFHYKHDICSFIDRNWAKLCPDKKRTLTWNNTVSAVITTHRKLFKSNSRQSGFWTLLPPPGMASLVADVDSEEENVDYAERAKEIKAQSRGGSATKKRKLSEISTPARASPAARAPGSAPSSFYKSYYADGPSPKLRKTTLAELHQPKPLNWNSPTPLFNPEAEETYVPISVRRRSRPPASGYFTRVHVRLQATADRKAFTEMYGAMAAAAASSSSSAATPHAVGQQQQQQHTSAAISAATASSSSASTSPATPTSSSSASTSHLHASTSSATSYTTFSTMSATSSNAMDVSAANATYANSNSAPNSGIPAGALPNGVHYKQTPLESPSAQRRLAVSRYPPTSSYGSTGAAAGTTGASSAPGGFPASPSPSSLSSPHTPSTPTTRQAKIIAANNLLVATAGLNSSSQSVSIMLKSNTSTRGAHDPYSHHRVVAHPQVLDPVIVPLPNGWFERSFKHPSLRKKSSSRNDIPLPVWKELDDDEEQAIWEVLQHEPDDEDISDERFLVHHKEYEKEEKKLKKFG